MNNTILFNDNWKFSEQPLHTTYEEMVTKDIKWQPVSLPHDWLIYDAKDLYKNSQGWYLKHYELEAISLDSITSLRFEGVYMNSFLYVNGKEVGTWKYGYSTFEMNISDYLIVGTNEIMVQVIHESPNSRWYSGAGIYRNVWLKTSPSTHLVSDGIYITTKQDKNHWSVDISTEVTYNVRTQFQHLELQHKIQTRNGDLITSSKDTITQNNTLETFSTHSTLLTVENPDLWNISNPILYSLTTSLIGNGYVLDEEVQTFGFRNISFDTNKGFFLNGFNVKLHGVCEHHDLGCLGAAVNKEAIRKRLVILQEMGVNAIRTTHNMPSVELMELADEMGILIVSEAFDMWERKKTTFDYARFFLEWAPKDVASWIRRDRNHPSVIMWSIGNEIYDTHADERGQELTRWLCDLVAIHDPNKNAFCTIGSNYMPWENARKCADIVKLAGYNYAEKYYDLHHKEHPDWIIYGSETSSTVQSRGVYHFPLSQSVLSDDDEQCSSLGNSSTSWGAKSTEHCIIDDRNAYYSPGQFIWTGFDYIGEPTPYHTKNSYFGQIDTAGFKKDSYYIYQAEWTNYKDKPMIHIFPYWDFSPGQLIDVRVCSNAPKIELFFNDVSLGCHLIDHEHGNQLLGEWKIEYAPGILRAIAYDENNTIVAQEMKTSFGDSSTLYLTPDKSALAANGKDLVFVEITALDNRNIPVENANNRVNITIEGPGVLVGLDNGDSTDYDQYKGYSRRMFNGKLLAVISSTFKPGDIKIIAESGGLETATLVITSLPAEIQPGSCEPLVYSSTPITNEIPIRKLEIICPQGNHLNKERTTVDSYVKVHPESATCNDIKWRMTNVAGIDSNIGFIKSNGSSVNITALGDGILYLRCMALNGLDKVTLYSQMEFHVTGLGTANLDPYDFISAGLHTFSSGNLTNGNERGMATARDGRSVIGFDRIDFGDFGSDEIVLPVFALDSEEFPIEIWEGNPDDGHGSIITVLTYQKPSIWNVYQEESYKLPKRLKGVTSLSFVLNRKIHLKGFYFTPLHKAYEQLNILEYSSIYGDSFHLTDTAIEEIGNNVSIVFEHMNFNKEGFTALTICGHSPLDKNTIQVRFQGNDGESTQLIEFDYSKDYVERTYSLASVSGDQTVTFVFLPGCQFDFKWFKFT